MCVVESIEMIIIVKNIHLNSIRKSLEPFL